MLAEDRPAQDDKAANEKKDVDGAHLNTPSTPGAGAEGQVLPQDPRRASAVYHQPRDSMDDRECLEACDA